MKQARRGLRVGRRLAAGLAALGAAAAGCAEAPGELILVVQTDMSLPEDINMIQIEITQDGSPKYKRDFYEIGQGQFMLPATLGVIASEDEPGSSVTLRASGWKVFGGGGKALVMREVVTQVPEGRVATLHLPLDYLCRGSAQTLDEDFKNAAGNCKAGYTCVGGECVPSKLEEAELAALPEYLAGDVFGGGTGKGDGACFDVARCFAEPTPAAINHDDCTIEAPPGDLSVALITEAEGMCNASGCYVALNAGSPGGWTRLDDGRIQLPPGACKPAPEIAGARPVAGVVTAPVSDGCPRKTIATPTCGPWSATGPWSELPPAAPKAIVAGQDTPVGLALGDAGAVYWVSSGRFAESAFTRAGAVKVVSGADTDVTTLEEGLSPRQVAVEGSLVFWAVQDPLADEDHIAVYDPRNGSITSIGSASQGGRIEGLAVSGDRVFWTDFATDEVMMMDTGPGSVAISLPNPPSSTGGPLHPFRIVAEDGGACWTNEGTFLQRDGSVICALLGGGQGSVVVATGQATPRGVALDQGAIYWTNFEDGTVMRAPRLSATEFGAPEPIATAQDKPNGIAIDGEAVYWTSWGDGSVKRLPKAAPSGEAAALLASGQDRPGAIAVSAEAIYWLNEGAPDLSTGAVIRLSR